MRVIAKRLMERRAFANRAVNQIGIRRVEQREDIGFDGNEQFIRSLGKLSQHGLAAYDDKLRAPVLSAAARMRCSSCGRCMAQAGFDLPDFGCREHAGERRILAQPLGVVSFRAK